MKIGREREKFCLLVNEELCMMCYYKSVDGKLSRTATRMVASQFSVSIDTVWCIWKRAKDCGDVSRKLSKTSRKKIEVDVAQIRNVPLHQWTTIRSLAHPLQLSHSTLFRHLKSGAIQTHSNAIKPYLKEENKRASLRFCISMLHA